MLSSYTFTMCVHHVQSPCAAFPEHFPRTILGLMIICRQATGPNEPHQFIVAGAEATGTSMFSDQQSLA